MAVTINASTSTGLVQTADTSGVLQLQTAGTNAVTVDASQNVGIGTTSPTSSLVVAGAATSPATVNGVHLGMQSGYATIELVGTSGTGALIDFTQNGTDSKGRILYDNTNNYMIFSTNNTERMRLTSNGDLLVAKASADFTVAGSYFSNNELVLTRDGNVPISLNRLTSDGALVNFFQASALEGSITVSGTTVSYNGGHISRWSQWHNQTNKPKVYRGTVLESVDAMCEWGKDGEPLPNEQSTKTIISTTIASKAVAGVFDRYDEDDKDNPYDFYVAQSGDFVIRIAQGVTVQNGDLLESAGDGTAKPQADDICRSSTVAKVTSNYVSATYEDGSYCVPCILMIG
jgi:hypothetical protein